MLYNFFLHIYQCNIGSIIIYLSCEMEIVNGPIIAAEVRKLKVCSSLSVTESLKWCGWCNQLTVCADWLPYGQRCISLPKKTKKGLIQLDQMACTLLD